LSIIDLSVKVLEKFKKEMHVNDMAVEISKMSPSIALKKDQLAQKLSSALSANLKTKQPLFSKIKNKKGGERRGVYRLKRVRQSDVVLLPFNEPKQSSDTGFIGKAGEYAVMSELLFKGFNVSLMTVDKGIDIIAVNESGKYFHIQAKTGTKSAEDIFTFSIKRKAFESNNSSQTFYIFVMRDEDKCNFLVISNSQIASYIALDVIRGADILSMRVFYDRKVKRYILNNREDVSIYVNRFGQIC